jgi:hypothetical protein
MKEDISARLARACEIVAAPDAAVHAAQGCPAAWAFYRRDIWNIPVHNQDCEYEFTSRRVNSFNIGTKKV